MKKLTPILIVAAATGICAMVVMSQCGYRPSGPAHLLKASDLTRTEVKFGRSPKRDRSVVYQPDVVVMENGTEAIRSLTPDGLGCVLDANARHASDLQVGKIAFVTGRCVGRILSSKREGDALTVILGPVELTDIFRKLEVTFDQPVDFAQAIEYPTLQLPQMTFPLEGPDAAPPSFASVSRVRDSYNALVLPSIHAPNLVPAAFTFWQTPGSAGILPTPLKVGFEATKPLNNSDGIGVELRHEGHGIRLVAQAQLRVKTPRLEFHLGIDNGNIDAKIVLHNAAGLKLAFDSAVSDQFAGNVDWYWVPPGSLSIPLSGPVPLSIDLRQQVWVQTVFSARQSSFSAGGDYDINADIGLTCKNRDCDPVGPKGFTVRKSMMKNMTGVSIGPSGLVISHVITVTGGLGMGGFTAGPSLELATSVGAGLGSSIGIVQCSSVSLAMNIRGGVGWTIPQPVVRFVNFFLRLVNVKPVKDHDGVFTRWKKLFQKDSYLGPSNLCGSTGGG